MPDVLHKRGTRSALDALAASSGLVAGQIYLITDESNRIAVALTASTYETFARESEAGGGAATLGGAVQPGAGLGSGLGDMVPGLLLGATNSTAVAPTAGRIYAVPFVPSRHMSLTEAGLRVTTQRSGSYALVALAESGANGKPATKLDQCSIDTAGTGVREASFAATVNLTAGMCYWLIFLVPSSVGTPATLTYISAAVAHAIGGVISDATSVNYWYVEGQSSIPSDLSALSWVVSTNSVPLVRLIGTPA